MAKPELYEPKIGGVDALFEGIYEATSDDASTVQHNTLSINSITFPKNQPRRYFDEEQLQKLATSVKERGILQPLIVRRLENGSYELVAGERRYRAAKMVGLKEVPVVVRELSDEEAVELALMENLQREDLNPLEQTEGILDLLGARGISRDEVLSLLNQASYVNRGQTLADNVVRQVEEIEKVLSVVGAMTPESFRKHRLPLLKLPEEIQMVVRQGKIQFTKARLFIKIKDQELRKKLLEQAIAEKWSKKEIESEINTITESLKPKRKSRTEKLVDQFGKTYSRIKKAKDKLHKGQTRRLEELLKEIDALLEAEAD